MNAKQVSEAMNEAATYKRKKKNAWVKWGAMAACLCILIVGGVMLAQKGSLSAPNPAPVESTNPILTVASAAEMETYLDFAVPILGKDVASYAVLVVDRYPTMGQVDYADGSQFRMQYGSDDISGIYGGTFVETQTLDGVAVNCYTYADTSYAIWQQDGFSFSYSSLGDASAEVPTLIAQFR